MVTQHRGHIVSILQHTSTGYYYEFGYYYDEFSPGKDDRIHVKQHRGQIGCREWLVPSWLACLKRELDAPDLWDQVRQERRLYDIAASRELENGAFTLPEREFLSEKIDALASRLLSSQQFQTQQIEILQQGLADVKRSTERFGKKDWLNYALGTMTTIIIAAGFAPQQTQALLRGFALAVQPVFEAVLKLISTSVI